MNETSSLKIKGAQNLLGSLIFGGSTPIMNSSDLYAEGGSTSTFFNETDLRAYLTMHLGPQRLALGALIPITIVYAVIFVTGTVGNISTCLVIVRSPHLQTATNYYLFSLAVSDVLTLLLGLPNDLWVYWRQYPYILGSTTCSLRALVSEMTSNASVLTIVAFTVERYLAICHPLFKQKMSNLSRVVKIITVLWTVACISAIPFAVLTTVNYVDYPANSGKIIEESAFCAMAVENNHRNMPLLLFSSCVFFVVPMSFIVVLYVKIGLKLRRSKVTRHISENHGGQAGRQSSSRKVLKLLVSVVVIFFICWAPFHAQRLLFVYVDAEGWTPGLRDVNEKLYYVAGCFYYVNCTTNPILYNVISRKYRRAFGDTLCCCCLQKRPHPGQIYYSSRYQARSSCGHSQQHVNGHVALEDRGDFKKGAGGETRETKYKRSARSAYKSFWRQPPKPNPPGANAISNHVTTSSTLRNGASSSLSVYIPNGDAPKQSGATWRALLTTDVIED